MTQSDLDAIRARLDAATPGPWVWGTDENRPDWRVVISTVHPIDVAHIPPWGGGQGELNADFVAYAPADIAALLAEVERLRDENAALRRVTEAARACWNSRVFTGPDDWAHYRVPNKALNAVASALAALDAEGA